VLSLGQWLCAECSAEDARYSEGESSASLSYPSQTSGGEGGDTDAAEVRSPVANFRTELGMSEARWKRLI